MKFMILGVDGYVGWALAQYLQSKNYEVVGYDNLSKRSVLEEEGLLSAVPIDSWKVR